MTPNELAHQVGYASTDNLRQMWGNHPHLSGHAWPGASAPIPENLLPVLLRQIATPYPNKPQDKIEAAAAILASMGEQVGDIVRQPKQGRVLKSPKRAAALPRERLPATAEQAELERARERRKLEAEARERFEAEQQSEAAFIAAQRRKYMPWVNALTWTLNALEMAFLGYGFWQAAGTVGAIAGGFLVVLGIIILLLVQMRGEAGGYAVISWGIVCAIGGWLVEYPAMLNAVRDAGSIVQDSGRTLSGISAETYAVTITCLIAGSSFCGTLFRYLKSNE